LANNAVATFKANVMDGKKQLHCLLKHWNASTNDATETPYRALGTECENLSTRGISIHSSA
jgi:hypothetical protein